MSDCRDHRAHGSSSWGSWHLRSKHPQPQISLNSPGTAASFLGVGGQGDISLCCGCSGRGRWLHRFGTEDSTTWDRVALPFGTEWGHSGKWDNAEKTTPCVTRMWCWEREARSGTSLPSVKHFGEAGAEGWDLAVTPSNTSLGLVCIHQAQGQPKPLPGTWGTCCQSILCFVVNHKSSNLRKPDTCGFQCCLFSGSTNHVAFFS